MPEQFNQYSLRNIPWDVWDVEKPTLWQINYFNQLCEQVGEVSISNMQFTREAYSSVIAQLVTLREKERNYERINKTTR